MKKILAMLLAVLTLLSLCACGSRDEEESEIASQLEEVQEDTAEELQDTAEEAADAAEDAADAAEAEAPDDGGEYGKSNAAADGLVDFDTLKAGYDWLEAAKKEFRLITYEEIRENMGGIDGLKTHEDNWTEERHVYIWKTEGRKDYLLLTFKVQSDGSEVMGGSSWSMSLMDKDE